MNGDVSLEGAAELPPIRLNVQAVNAAAKAAGEVRRTMGVRAAAKALPAIFARAGIRIEPVKPEQGELALGDHK
jgi:hypothetical protein